MSKSFVVGLLIVEFVVCYCVVGSACLLRRDMVQAFTAWHKHPSAETKRELERQERISESQKLVISGVIFCGLAAVTMLIARGMSEVHLTKHNIV